jgi:hypothetical protein
VQDDRAPRAQACAVATTGVIASTVFVFLGLACGAPCSVAAQKRLELVAYVGRYRPTSILGSGAGVTLKQQASVTEGARLTLWWPGRLGIEATVGAAPSALWSSHSGLNYPAAVQTASAKVLLQVTPTTARAALRVGGGVGRVGHSGMAYPTWYVGPTTFLGGIANIGASIKLTPWLVGRFDAEDFVYAAHVGRCTRTTSADVCDIWTTAGFTGVQATPTASVLQHDVVLSIGIGLSGPL